MASYSLETISISKLELDLISFYEILPFFWFLSLVVSQFLTLIFKLEVNTAWALRVGLKSRPVGPWRTGSGRIIQNYTEFTWYLLCAGSSLSNRICSIIWKEYKDFGEKFSLNCAKNASWMMMKIFLLLQYLYKIT